MVLEEMTHSQLVEFKKKTLEKYNALKAQNMNLNMTRGVPAKAQLDLSMKMLDCVSSQDSLITENGVDCRSYGVLDGIDEAKKLFCKMIEVGEDEIFIGANSSLNLMYDCFAKAMIFGLYGSEKPWGKYDKIKFLCPVPGYDRHFRILETFGIEMINVPLDKNGPDMDMVEKLAASDETIKGIYCVPKYSNPTGTTYSDDTVRRLAKMKTKAKDFRIFWDNAYCIHDITDTPDVLLNIFEECKKNGTEDRVFIFGSTSKISFPGAGIAFMGASKKNLDFLKSHITVQTIGCDKINQLRHVKFFKDFDGIKKHMQKHRAIIEPKFKTVLDYLDKEIAPLGIGKWYKPNGGYFISFDTLDGCAKRTVELCREAGVTLTPAGATYPYGKDPHDSNIRLAPTFPPVEELQKAMDLFCTSVKLASVEKLLGE